MPRVTIFITQADIDAADRIARAMFPETPGAVEATHAIAMAARIGMKEMRVIWEPDGKKNFGGSGKMKENGGPAFPSPGVVLNHGAPGEHQQGPYEGMSLRDYFAAAALQGLCANDNYDSHAAAGIAYAHADAMLAERDK